MNEEIFRDTKDWYLDKEKYASSELVKFAAEHSGKEILDLGCATGDYCKNLQVIGFDCTGVDINPQYIKIARSNGINAHVMKGDDLNFPDDTFDTVLLFEVLEHVDNPHKVLKEAKRVARKNILITVPNCTQIPQLRHSGLTYEHVLEKDHVNFFTKNDLEELISRESNNFKVMEGEPINLNQLLVTIGLPIWLIFPIAIINKIKPIKTSVYYRLFAVIEV